MILSPADPRLTSGGVTKGPRRKRRRHATCILMGIAWPLLVDKKITVERAIDLPFLAFALGGWPAVQASILTIAKTDRYGHAHSVSDVNFSTCSD